MSKWMFLGIRMVTSMMDLKTNITTREAEIEIMAVTRVIRVALEVVLLIICKMTIMTRRLTEIVPEIKAIGIIEKMANTGQDPGQVVLVKAKTVVVSIRIMITAVKTVEDCKSKREVKLRSRTRTTLQANTEGIGKCL